MPIFRNKVLGATQFTATDDTNGLFSAKPGSGQIQVRINGLYYHTAAAGGPSDLSISIEDPQDTDNEIILFSEMSVSNLYVLNGFLLPTEEDFFSWPLLVKTTTKAGDAWLTIDYDFEVTEGL